ncbi:MFS transporter [Arthrobacter sp. MYb227]|uniref:MFS transporter n=1 Tax=Arthrobacter sp. MYb227 TaxID=1848601 RepID=UPI000CFCCF8A|nr:MFS transporter [Arthrobacter sp. MYb227]PQZ94584.1 MFS transporter [Arthrobacter sp. MYb227]
MHQSQTTRAHRLTVAILAASGMLTSLQFTLFVPSLGIMAETLEISANDATWIVTITLLTGTVATPVLTRMADMYGRRRLLLLSIGLLVSGALIAACGMTFAWVLVGRALQGFASSIVPIGMSLLREILPPQRAGSAVGLMSGTLGVGSAAGLLLSGALSESFGVAALFWFTVCAGLLAGTCMFFIVHETNQYAGGRFDFIGAMLLAVVLASALLMISKGGAWGWSSTAVLSLAVLGLLAFLVWVPHQLRHPQAVIDLRTAFRRPVFQTNLATFFAALGMFGNHLLTVHEVQAPQGIGAGLALGPAVAGLTMVPAALAMASLSPVAGMLLNRFEGRMVLALGSAVMALAFIFRFFVRDSLTGIIVGATLVGVGTALSFAAMPALIMSYVPRAQAAAANGINSLLRTLSGAVASAVFGLVVSTFAISSAGTEHIGEVGLSIAFAALASSCALAALLALLLPANSHVSEPKPLAQVKA